jgi:hypothetical protein
MRMCGALGAALLATSLVLAVSNPVEASDESPFLLQDHGTVRVVRGVEPGKNFAAAKLPEEAEESPDAAPAPQAESQPTATQQGPTYTREAALKRARLRGITTHRAGVFELPPIDSGRNRREALKRLRERAGT